MQNTRTNGPSMLLYGARPVLPSGIAEGADLLIEDGHISRIIFPQDETPHPPDIIDDARGLTIYPGFIDLHIHGAVGVDTMEADADGLHLVAEFLAAHGVTGWLPTLVPAPDEDYKKASCSIEQAVREQSARPPAARILGIHYEGPFVNTAQCGALRTEYFRTFKGPEDIAPLVIIDDAARMITLAPEIEGGIELTRELKKRGWIVSIGHTRASVDILDQAHAAGAHHMTHFLNAMSPLHHRNPGPIGWGLVKDSVTCDIIADGVHSDPLMLSLVMRSKTSARLALISDAVSPAGLGEGEFQIWGEKIAVENGRTRNSRGSIAGSVITVLDAVQMMLSLGATETEVAQMASLNPARLLGIESTCGSIEEGKRADLVALDENEQVKFTLIGGEMKRKDEEGTTRRE